MIYRKALLFRAAVLFDVMFLHASFVLFKVNDFFSLYINVLMFSFSIYNFGTESFVCVCVCVCV